LLPRYGPALAALGLRITASSPSGGSVSHYRLLVKVGKITVVRGVLNRIMSHPQHATSDADWESFHINVNTL